jgi:hypothetical protein
MTHPLEVENEDLKKRIESTYDECAKIDMELTTYNIKDMIESLTKKQEFSTEYMNTILTNEQTFNDIIKWGNGK